MLADPHAVTELAANVVDLAAMRASFDRAGRLIDEYVDAHLSRAGDAGRGAGRLRRGAGVQGVPRRSAAVRVVDRALALSGGAGYLAKHPLSKAWRDVRAGGFMHPVGANRADVLLARTALGVAPDIEPTRHSARRASSTAASPSSAAPSASAAS